MKEQIRKRKSYKLLNELYQFLEPSKARQGLEWFNRNLSGTHTALRYAEESLKQFLKDKSL